MKKKIAVLPGDGIGPEVTKQAIKVLEVIAERFGHEFEYEKGLVGAVAIEATGDPLPKETLETCLNADSILFGAIGDPKYDNNPNAKVRPEQGLLRLRKELGLYANIRPVKTYDSLIQRSPLKEENIKGTDLVIYRELAGGIYFGEKGRSEDGESAYDHCTYSVAEIERIAKLAFQAAQNRRKKLTLIDKANVLETSRLWRQTVQVIAQNYPDVEVEYLFVDNAAMQIILRPNQFDVILTENMFGDIISDESSVITGSIGLLPSASIGEKASLFEPIHGSYPQAAGKDIANPIAMILSVAMMLNHFGLKEEAELINTNITFMIKKGLVTQDLHSRNFISCSKVGDALGLLLDKNIEGVRFENMFEGKLPVI
ncbi:MAG: 3-isopropylmalate dehydrogenase [Balneola sp.]|jgi:3-isopropylmalate dehydrogenase|nr:3-isopropylmalate dehydrogenase [Balneola sp.]MBE80572.1 3-isopropylmalate dehydrogenase [Balneola sp.]MBE80624.1 3-isopropylmalate dehydrogenase [Balneola sp.]|tara:strand:- start:304 stop:1416 length:1113 start_codon:yes stop_codon:yes gene_type:complete